MKAGEKNKETLVIYVKEGKKNKQNNTNDTILNMKKK